MFDLHVTTGIVASVVCFLLYAVPILTFKRVIRKGSVEEFSCIPYILTLFSNLTYTWYGLPVVSSGWENWTLSGISSIGVLFSSTFIIIYTWFAPRGKKKLIMMMVSPLVIIVVSAVLLSSFAMHTHQMRKAFVGSINLVASVLMYGSPLVAVKQVIRTKSVEFMPFYLSLFSFLTSLLWMLYGILGKDPFLTAPSAIGCLMGIIQLIVYCIYSKCKEAPKTNPDIERADVMKVSASQEDTKGQKP
ncbi:bidirectional sugar transporter SWEET3a-like [Lolium rigidum]|uniref:bidirectional sugar transporter SWEET3a-like n=1 Tax=Lolium rigidum TaxID=89674 RepID=UPI001F5CE22E|nr:bidirectional sugar transporter SWEET3a-like [Lolium rigidum]